jgi:hypothetical protein
MLTRIRASTESWLDTCNSSMIYELRGKKQVFYVLPIDHILGKLPVVPAGDTGTIPFKHRNSGRFDRSLASADTAAGKGNGNPLHFINTWAMTWSRDM